MEFARKARRSSAVGPLLALVIVVSGCTAYDSEVIAGSSIAVAWEGSFTAYNPATTFGGTATNLAIAAAVNSSFVFYDDTPELVSDSSFGSSEILSESPLVVRYTVADGVAWSDGVAVDAIDLLLNWLALSGAYNDPETEVDAFIDPETGQATAEYPDSVVFFDSGVDPREPDGLALVSTLPLVSDDRKSITLTFDSPDLDWELLFPSAGLPAHVIGQRALGVDDPHEARDAVFDAIQTHDDRDLAAISRFWNTGFNFTEMPDPDLVLSTGPYVITDFVADQYVVLSANPRYAGLRMPTIEQVMIRTVYDPLAAVQAMTNGTVQVIAPQVTADAVNALSTFAVSVEIVETGAYEHLDLQFENSKSGHFDDARVREAFLKTVPRDALASVSIGEIDPQVNTRDSFVFFPGTDDYRASVGQNGSAAFDEPDIEGARALLEQAGVTEPEVCILFASTNPRRVVEFDLIRESAAQAGIAVTDCSSPDWRDLLGVPGAYDAALFAWQSDNLGVAAIPAAYGSEGSNNLSFYSSESVDAALRTLTVGATTERSAGALTQIDAQLWSDFFGLPLYQYPAVVAFDSNVVEGVSPSPIGAGLLWNLWEWSLVGEK